MNYKGIYPRYFELKIEVSIISVAAVKVNNIKINSGFAKIN